MTYGRIVLLALPAYTLQFEFQSFFVTAERPQLGLAVTVLSGLTNMVLDALLVAVFPWGCRGGSGHSHWPVRRRHRAGDLFLPAQFQPFAPGENRV